MNNRQDKEKFSSENSTKNYNYHDLRSSFLALNKVLINEINHHSISTHEKLQIIYANIRV